MRYAIVPPSGEVNVLENEERDIALILSTYEAIVVGGVSLYYEPKASGKYNWQATRLARDVLTGDDRICGDVVIFGPPVDGHPGDLPEEVIDTLRERLAARG